MAEIKKPKRMAILPTIWGPPAWKFLKCVAYGYPIMPSQENKDKYKAFFENLAFVMPCKHCRESYKIFIKAGDMALTDEVMQSQETLTKWFYKINVAVDCKLGMNYDLSYNDVSYQCESYRAKKDMTEADKAKAYELSLIQNCPVIEYEMAVKFSKYISDRGIDVNRYMESIDKYHKISQDKQSDMWRERNIICQHIIEEIKKGKYDAIEKDGPHKDLPSMKELELMSYLCTTICIDELDKMLRLLDVNKKRYKLVN